MVKTQPPLPRGIRNNNPGNIRLSKTKWQGQKSFQFDPDFIEFDTPVMGLRAVMKLLVTYQRKYGLDTVESIINRYAPPHENATDGYIESVCKAMNVKRRARLAISTPATLILLTKAICLHENGRAPQGGWYPEAFYLTAANLALHGE